MTIFVNGRPYSTDWSATILEALDEWKQALSGTNLAFERVYNQADANLVISVEDSPPSASTAIELGGTILRHGRQPTKVRLFRKGFQDRFNNKAKIASNLRFVTGGEAELLKFLTRMAAKHELGHALGLEHAQVRAGPGIRVTVPPVGTPIMIPEPDLFLAGLFAVVNRMGDVPNEGFVPDPSQTLLTADNIGIAPQEQAALTALVRTQQATCSSLFIVCIKAPYIDDGEL